MRLLLITAVGAALVLAGSAPGWADAAAGKAAFTEKGCNACHYTDGPAREKSIDDQLAKKGPELWYAGSKFQKAWLGAWLQAPKPIRPLKYGTFNEKNPGDHPKLAGAGAADMTDFLMGLTSDAVEAGVIKPKKNLKGRLIFIKKISCGGCHQSPGRRGKVSGGLSGPSLVGAKKRLNPDWIYAYLKTPSVFKPVKAMPTFAGIFKDEDMKNVATHVANMK